MKMILLLSVFLISIEVQGQNSTTFILVRHSEKAVDGTKNPSLSDLGIKRSQRLLELLEKANISAVYSTDLKRTIQTIEGIAKAKNLDIQKYNWEDPEDLANSLFEKNLGGTVLVSGHSNTTPFLANALLGKKVFEQFDDSDYSNILMITLTQLGQGQLVHLSF